MQLAAISKILQRVVLIHHKSIVGKVEINPLKIFCFFFFIFSLVEKQFRIACREVSCRVKPSVFLKQIRSQLFFFVMNVSKKEKKEL